MTEIKEQALKLNHDMNKLYDELFNSADITFTDKRFDSLHNKLLDLLDNSKQLWEDIY